jgi:hypothetical protein
MKIETLMTAGHQIALYAMRAPYQSWIKSDTIAASEAGPLTVGPNDRDLSQSLQDAGPEHCKHLRLIQVWVRLQAPRYWLLQFDTYRAGVEKVSTSTMHTLMRRHLTADDFAGPVLPGVVDTLNQLIDTYKKTTGEKRRIVWERIICNLPQSYIQERVVIMSYAAIRAMYHQRKGHKLGEWAEFRRWAQTLPCSWMITDGDEE